VQLPGRDRDAFVGKRTLPRIDVRVVGVDQGSIYVEQDGGSSHRSRIPAFAQADTAIPTEMTRIVGRASFSDLSVWPTPEPGIACATGEYRQVRQPVIQ
jgi:hypothetical protein